ncbi:MAG: DUF222 domain-containing protein, partial [Acidimicrobiales bacterium]
LAARETLGGMVDVQGRLDPVNGAIFTGELRRLERQMFEADWAAARAVHGDSTQGDHLARSSEQRHADALVEMARRSAAMPADAKAARIVLTVLVGYETFAGRVCELANGTVVTPREVARLSATPTATPRPPSTPSGSCSPDRHGFSTSPPAPGSFPGLYAGRSRSATATAPTPAVTPPHRSAMSTTSSNTATAAPPLKTTAASSAPPTTANAPAAAAPHRTAPSQGVNRSTGRGRRRCP